MNDIASWSCLTNILLFSSKPGLFYFQSESHYSQSRKNTCIVHVRERQRQDTPSKILFINIIVWADIQFYNIGIGIIRHHPQTSSNILFHNYYYYLSLRSIRTDFLFLKLLFIWLDKIETFIWLDKIIHNSSNLKKN